VFNKSFLLKIFFFKKNRYLKVWNHYNKKILESLEKVDRSFFL